MRKVLPWKLPHDDKWTTELIHDGMKTQQRKFKLIIKSSNELRLIKSNVQGSSARMLLNIETS